MPTPQPFSLKSSSDSKILELNNRQNKITLLGIEGDYKHDFLIDLKRDFALAIPEEYQKLVSLRFQSKFLRNTQKVIYRGIETSPYSRKLPAFKRRKQSRMIALILGPDFSQFLLPRLLGFEISFYMMDAWPQFNHRIQKAIRLLDVKKAFYSSSQAANQFRLANPNVQCTWLPEAVLAEKYRAKAVVQRHVDVLAFGRKWDAFHQKIVGPLKAHGHSYIYEQSKGTLIAPDQNSFLELLSSSKISICVPSNITHPERSGDIETLTQRYLQSMISKCIVVGKAPKELIDLFGYNPVVEVDLARADQQILEILRCPERYVDLVNQNFEIVSRSHQWRNRWETIVKAMLN